MFNQLIFLAVTSLFGFHLFDRGIVTGLCSIHLNHVYWYGSLQIRQRTVARLRNSLHVFGTGEFHLLYFDFITFYLTPYQSLPHQVPLQKFLLIVALLSVPVLLLGKPMIIKNQMKKRQNHSVKLNAIETVLCSFDLHWIK